MITDSTIMMYTKKLENKYVYQQDGKTLKI
jgi:hypothetical protein